MMNSTVQLRAFEPGTTGWTVEDLDDPDILWQWSEGRFELVDGVLTKMAPQGFEGIDPQSNLRKILDCHLTATGQEGVFYHEVDLLLRRGRVARPDMLFLTAEQRRRQKELQRERKPGRGKYHPVYVTPYLVVESMSVGHEDHDRVTKREWYSEAGIPRYWVLTGFERSLVCYVLDGKYYIQESAGKDNETVLTQAFGGVSIPLIDVWDEV